MRGGASGMSRCSVIPVTVITIITSRKRRYVAGCRT